MKKWLLILALPLSLLADTVWEQKSNNWHSPDKRAKIEYVTTEEGAPAVKFTAPVFGQLRLPFQPPADWSGVEALEFRFKVERTMGIGFGYIHSHADPAKWGTRIEFNFNKALGQGGSLPGGRWMTGRIALPPPSETFNPAAVLLLTFGLTDYKTAIDKETPVTFYISGLKLCREGGGEAVGNPAAAEKYRQFLDAFAPDLSEIAPEALPQDGLPLVRDGRAVAEIILGEGELAKSAEELQLWIGKISGATLPILTAPSAENNAKIFLGRSFAATRRDDLNALAGSDGYALRREGNRIFIFGAEPRGTLNGCFAFLEKNSDLIWPRPAPEMNAVFSRTPSFFAAYCDELSRPRTLRRGWGTNGGLNIDDESWNSRNFCNAPLGGGGFDPGNQSRIPWGNFLTYGGGHNLYQFLPGEKFFDTHPEFYALINGARQAPKAMENNPCFTNPAMLDAFVQSVLEHLRRNPLPDNSSLGIQIEDNWGLCECDGCRAPIVLPDGGRLTEEAPNFRSTQFYLWMNRLAERVLKEFPKLKLHTYAYFFTAPAPAIAVHPAVGAKFCPYIRPNDKYPLAAKMNAEWYDRIAAWCKVSPRVILREYYGVGMDFPRPLAEMVAHDLRTLVPLGVMEHTSEIAPDRNRRGSETVDAGYRLVWDASFVDFWVITRLWWNPEQEVEGLRRHFYRRAFRSAAMPMAGYYALLRESWYRDSLPSTCGDGAVNSFRHYIIDKQQETRMRSLLEEAERLADHPVSRELIRRHRARFEAFAEAARQLRTPSASVPLQTRVDFAKALRLTDFSRMGKRTVLEKNGTVVQVAHDAKNLHVRFICDADPEKLTGAEHKPGLEQWTSGDHVELFLRDGADPNVYYQFAVDWRGNRCDLDNRTRMKWNGDWKSLVRRTGSGYEVDLVIPFQMVNWSLANPEVKALFMREDNQNGKTYSSWGGGTVHQLHEFGELKLMR